MKHPRFCASALDSTFLVSQGTEASGSNLTPCWLATAHCIASKFFLARPPRSLRAVAHMFTPDIVISVTRLFFWGPELQGPQ